jgi:hypothetical protein
MSAEDITPILIGVIFVGIFVLIFILNKKSKPDNEVESKEERIARGVRGINKIRNAKNDKEFIEGIMDLPGRKKSSANKKPLIFKGSLEAFEYIQKFIETLPLKKGSAFYGVLGSNATMARIHCKFKGKVETMMVTIDEKKYDGELEMDDLVLVGIKDVGKGLNVKKALDFAKLKDKSPQSIANALMKIRKSASVGTILAKVKPELNTNTMKFDIYDD